MNIYARGLKAGSLTTACCPTWWSIRLATCNQCRSPWTKTFHNLHKKSEVVKFADDIKIGCEVTSVKNCKSIQSDFVKLAEWSDRLQMNFNVDKCKDMHRGDNNPKFKCLMHVHELNKVKQEKDIGVIISSTLQVSNQCSAASEEANMTLELISRNTNFKSPRAMKR